MKKYSDEIKYNLNNFVYQLEKLREAVEKFNNYVYSFNNSSAFVVALTNEQQKQIKASVYNLSLKISSFKFDEIIDEFVRLINEQLMLYTQEDSMEIDKNLVLLEEIIGIYAQSYSKTICQYSEYTNNLTVIQTKELIEKGLSVIIVIDNIIKKISVLLT